MKTISLTLMISLSTLVFAMAETKPAYAPKTKSDFNIATPVRNPFWPIGFTPTKKVANQVVEEQLLRIPIENFKVTSIFGGDPAFAVINGKDYTKGQFLNMPTPTGMAKLLITQIEDGYVVVQYKALVSKIEISRK